VLGAWHAVGERQGGAGSCSRGRQVITWQCGYSWCAGCVSFRSQVG
jgi:hypothetical protein